MRRMLSDIAISFKSCERCTMYGLYWVLYFPLTSRNIKYAISASRFPDLALDQMWPQRDPHWILIRAPSDEFVLLILNELNSYDSQMWRVVDNPGWNVRCPPIVFIIGDNHSIHRQTKMSKIQFFCFVFGAIVPVTPGLSRNELEVFPFECIM